MDEFSSQLKDGNFEIFKGSVTSNTDIAQFQWTSAIKTMKEENPLVYEVFNSLLPPSSKLKVQFNKGPSREKRCLTDDEAQQKRDAKMGILVSMVLYTRNPWVYNKIASIIGILLWMEGASQRLFRSLNFFGVCQSLNVTRQHVDNIRTGFDEAALSWKARAEDLMNDMFNPQSRGNKGSLFHMKIVFGYMAAQNPVMSHFKNVWNLVSFVTEGLTTLLFLKHAHMNATDEIPVVLDDKSGDDWLDHLVTQMVDRIWRRPDASDIRGVKLAYQESDDGVESEEGVEHYFPFCFCLEDKEQGMVQCCNSHCPRGWIHFQCASPPLTTAPSDDWYCCDDCESGPDYIYCHCQDKKGGRMVQCAMKEQCLAKEWYHSKCLGYKARHKFPAKWYCSEQCQLQEENCDDGVLQYSLSLLWQGLNLLIRRHIVRDGNGPLMLSMWRLDMLQFWANKHPKYLRIGHGLLAYTGGFLPEQDAFEIIWNRVANGKGKSHGNIPLDLLNEHLNKDFKEMIKHSRGQYTTQQIQRCSQMGGAFRDNLNGILLEAGMSGEDVTGGYKTKEPSLKKLVEDFVEEYRDEALFDYCPPRQHSAFPDFKHTSCVIRSPHKLGRTLKEMSLQLDVWSSIASAAST